MNEFNEFGPSDHIKALQREIDRLSQRVTEPTSALLASKNEKDRLYEANQALRIKHNEYEE